MIAEKNQKENWEQIWYLFKKGNEEAFAKLYNFHIQTLYQYGSKLSSDRDTVNDAIQEVFIDLYLRHKEITTTPEKLKYYLIFSLRHNIIRRLKGKRQTPYREIGEIYYFSPQYSFESQLIQSEEETEIREKLNRVIGELPSKQKEALYLRFNESLEYGEIAKILEITVESVRKQVYRALKSIKEIVGDKGIVLFFLFSSKKN